MLSQHEITIVIISLQENCGGSTAQKCEEEKKEDSKDCPNVEETREKEQKPKADEVPKEDDTGKFSCSHIYSYF